MSSTPADRTDGVPARPAAVQRGVSTISGPGRPRSGVQRGVSTFSARSADQESRIQELLSEQSIQEELLKEEQLQLPPPTLFRRILNVAGHFALIVMLGVYSAAGGMAFVYLEKPQEEMFQAETRATVKLSKEDLWNYTVNLIKNCECNLEEFNETAWNKTLMDFEGKLTNYSKSVHDAALSKVDVHNEPKFQWTFAASMFFSTTVITTIGYGNMAPVTSYGRVFCIVYAIVGIPLTLIAIGDMGKLFANFVKAVYKKIKRHRQLLRPPPPPPDVATDEATLASAAAGTSTALTSLKVLGAMTLLILYIAMGGGMFLLWESWSFLDSFYFCFITMTTIGLGDLVPEHQMYMLLCTVYILIGLALTSTCIELARSEYEKSWQRMLEASKRLQMMKLMKKLGEQIEMAGGDMDLIQDLKNALGGKKQDEKPPPIVWYETTV